MNEFTISTRIKHKYKTEEEWLKGNNFTPLKGELIIYAPDDKYKNLRFKVGDGDTPLHSLKFFESNGDSGQGFLNILQEYQNKTNWNIEELYLHLGELGDLLTDEVSGEGLQGDDKTEIPTARAMAEYVKKALDNVASIRFVTWDPDDDLSDLESLDI